jgi:hypothetical protein
MRRARARGAAAFLAFALLAPGCDLVSSLTPFGIGHQDYRGGVENVNGDWVGSTASGGEVTFQVGNNSAARLHFLHVAPGCTLTFEDLATLVPVIDNTFTVEIRLDQGRFVATGNFTSSGTATGTYFFEALQAGICPTAGSGTFFANKKL